MEHQLWRSIVAVLAALSKRRKQARYKFGDEDIVKVHYWAVLHDRPICWACDLKNWPLWRRRRSLPPLPSPAAMSRRLKSVSVRELLGRLEERVIAPKEPGLFWMIDGKPMTISGCSKDRQAGYGRAAGGKAKGYKIHAIVDTAGDIAAWRVAPMNKDERVMGERLLRTAVIHGYVAGDTNYDSNKLHKVCDQHPQLHLITRRRYGATKGTGHRKQMAGRLHSMRLVENPYPAFAERMLLDRSEIERRFGQITNWGGGLTCLPPWVRTHRRVHRWVQAKLVLTALKRSMETTTCAA
jgi:hypothetical protein